jgi:hypothetical protein
VQDLGGWQDDHAENDLEESQKGCGQDALACRCPLEQELLGGLPQWQSLSKAEFNSCTACCDVHQVPHYHTAAV